MAIHYGLESNKTQKPLLEHIFMAIEGMYNATGHDLAVTLKQGQLYTRFGNNKPRLLIAVDRQRFRRENEPIATIAFSRFQGRLYLQGEFGNYQRLPLSISANGDSYHD